MECHLFHLRSFGHSDFWAFFSRKPTCSIILKGKNHGKTMQKQSFPAKFPSKPTQLPCFSRTLAALAPGTAPVLPRHAFGLFQSHGFFGMEETMEVMGGFFWESKLEIGIGNPHFLKHFMLDCRPVSASCRRATWLLFEAVEMAMEIMEYRWRMKPTNSSNVSI